MPVNRNVKIKALLAAQEEERRWLFEKSDVLDTLEKGTGICLDRFKVGSYLLFGARSITVGDSMGFNKKHPTYHELHTIAAFLKPLPMTLIKSGCTSFHPTETLTEKDTKYGTATDIIPFHVRLERNNRTDLVVSVEWYAKVLDKIYCVTVHMVDTVGHFGSINRFKTCIGYQHGQPIYEWKCQVSWGLNDLFRDNKLVAKAKELAWYSCGEYKPYTRYWEIVDRRYSVTPIDMLNTMEVACTYS